MTSDTQVGTIPLIGPTSVEKLAKLDIQSVIDLLYHLPHRFEDTSIIVKINEITYDQSHLWTVKGQISEIETIYTRYGKRITQAILEDETGIADLLWFNQPYLSTSIPKHTDILISGKVSFDDFVRPKFVSPSYEIIKQGGGVHLGKLTPIYPETKGVSSKWLRSRIAYVLKELELNDWMPADILKAYTLPNLSWALNHIHNPLTLEEFERAKGRIAFDEMLLVQLIMLQKRAIEKKETAITLKIEEKKKLDFINSLPYTLTPSQIDCINDIFNDLAKPTPMNRLLEGEVGSGKTVVAASAIFLTTLCNKKSAIMAPTSILAKQHYETMLTLLKPLGLSEDNISLVTNKHKANLDAQIFIGTQALLFSEEIIKEIVFCVIDEQHRFGVHQREKLTNKQGESIHSLVMTATPIPRTLALSIYGDLDISYINELPGGRKPIQTNIVPSNKRDDMYQFIRDRIKRGEQAFIICPLVSQSEKLNLKSAEEEYERLKKEVFPDLKLALLHGQMKPIEKDDILEAFKNKEYDILVATPVVEVGIDIPNASVILIEGAERFGLAQLHQLRGRVGRGVHQSYCLLATTEVSHEDKERLHVFAKNSSGLKIAEYDLQNRGPGEVYGIKQSGVPTLKVASLLDSELISKTRTAANDILAVGIDKYPLIDRQLKHFLDKVVNKN